jgi:aminoacylase
MRIRVEANWTFADVTKMLDNICTQAGPGVRYEFILKSEIFGETRLEDSNIWWKTFRETFDEM